MPRQPTRRQNHRATGPYDLRSEASHAPPQMADFMHPLQSPHHWPNSHFAPYPTNMMPPIHDYTFTQPMHTPGIAASAMATPALPQPAQHRPSRHSSHPSQSTPWNADEDSTLILARNKEMGWSAICDKYFPGKTGNACRKRYERLMAKRKETDWDGERLDRLAAFYMDVRAVMWAQLGEMMGEKWDVVEKICMQQGLKTLKNKASHDARSRNGHSRGHSSSGFSHTRLSAEYDYSDSTEFDDSGLGGIGLGVGRAPPRHARRISLQQPLDNSILHHPNHTRQYSGYQ